MAKLRTIVSGDAHHVFISSHLSYCNALFSCLSKASSNRLQFVQSARFLTLKPSLITCFILFIYLF